MNRTLERAAQHQGWAAHWSQAAALAAADGEIPLAISLQHLAAIDARNAREYLGRFQKWSADEE